MKYRFLPALALALALIVALTSCVGEGGRSSMGRQAAQVAREGREARSKKYYTLGPKFEGQLDQMVGQEIYALTGRKEDLPLELNQDVLVNLNYFLNDARGFMTRSLSRGQKYIPMMKAILRQKGLPEDLVYLALIESGFRTEAVSTASAVGPWQFISSTGRRYGLVINEWIDERMDPVKSTYAAADYLTTLHDMFNSWPLAIAAYNSGEGKVQKGMRRLDVDNFWDMAKGSYLAAETKRYVPSFLAAAIIAKDPAAYGIEVDTSTQDAWEDVIVPEPVDLDLASQLAGSNLSRLKELNPHLKKLTIPPGEDNFVLRVPQGSSAGFYKNYASLPAARRRSALILYAAKRGDTVEKVALNHNLTPEIVRSYNNIEGSRLARGQELVLPPSMPDATVTAMMTPSVSAQAGRGSSQTARANAAAAAAAASRTQPVLVAEAEPEREPLTIQPAIAPVRVTTALAAPAATEARTPSAPRRAPTASVINSISHRVRSGDTISGLAKLYGVQAEQIRTDNQLAGNDIREGQVLSIRSNITLSTPAAERRSRDTWVEVTEGVPVYHTVKKGETVGVIAANYKITQNQLRSLNALASDSIKAGQKLVVGIGPPEPGDGAVYVVKSGDTVSTIAERYKLKSDELRRLNNLSSDNLQIGQKLMVAAASSSPQRSQTSSNPAPNGVDTYTVVGGDTVSTIAERFGMRSDDLRKLNNLSSDFLRIGQELKVAQAAPPEKSAQPLPPLLPGVESYEVQKGDTVGGIAERFGMSSQALRDLNEMADDKLRAGRRILVRPETKKARAEEAPPKTEPPAAGYYEVQSGDTLSGIAEKHSMRTAELRELNELEGDKIRIGQRLRVAKGAASAPKKVAEPVPALAPVPVVPEGAVPAQAAAVPTSSSSSSAQAAPAVPASQSRAAAVSVTAPSALGSQITIVQTGPPSGGQAPASAKPGTAPYTVKSGDTVSSVALRFGMRASELRELNGLDGDRIRIGQTILVPAAAAAASGSSSSGSASSSASSSSASSSSASSSGASSSGASSGASSGSSQAAIPAGGIYEVKSGDTVSTIAERFGLRSAQLRELNNLANDNIRIGQKLRLSGSAQAQGSSSSSGSSGRTVAASAAAGVPAAGGVYEVKSGDTVSTIAERFGMRSAELRELNGLEGDKIRIGQKLQVRGAPRSSSGSSSSATSVAAVRVAGDIYEVKSGDTVSTIAERFGLKSAELRELNGLEGDKIRIGQKLKVKK